MPHRYSSAPTSLPLNIVGPKMNTASLSTLTPITPSPSEVDPMLHNTFASTPSPLSQQWSSTSCSGHSEDSGIYDTLSKKRDTNDQSGVEDRCEWQKRGGKESGGGGKESEGGGKESAGEDCYVLIQSKFGKQLTH